MTTDRDSSADDLFFPLDDGLGPALPISEAALDAAAKAAVAGALSAKPVPLRRLKKRPMLLLAAIVVLPSLAAAFVVAYSQPEGASDTSPTAAADSSVVSNEKSLPPSGAQPTVEEEPTTDVPSVESEDTKTVLQHDRESANEAPVRRATRAEDMLKKANGLRREGRWNEAASTYSRVARAYPGSAQASVASLAAASLYLEHLGKPSHALGLYQRTRRSQGLAAEADLGIARCYRALGDREREIQALKKLIKTYPGALSTQRSQRRLEELQATRP